MVMRGCWRGFVKSIDMRNILLLILLLPLLSYSQPNAVFKSLRVNNLKVLDSVFIEDNVSKAYFTVQNNGIIHIHDTIKLDQPLTAHVLRFHDSEVGLITLSELANREIEIGNNLLTAIAILSVVLLCIAGIIKLGK